MKYFERMLWTMVQWCGKRAVNGENERKPVQYIPMFVLRVMEAGSSWLRLRPSWLPRQKSLMLHSEYIEKTTVW